MNKLVIEWRILNHIDSLLSGDVNHKEVVNLTHLIPLQKIAATEAQYVGLSERHVYTTQLGVVHHEPEIIISNHRL
jgi:hypothetical protein